jgi:hypothetical protein
MSNETRRAGNTPTTAQLKEAIDRGAAADKVDFPDPAASPLGTDAEAGGMPPTPAEVASAYPREIAGKADPAPQNRTLLAIAGFIAVIAVAVIFSILVMQGL